MKGWLWMLFRFGPWLTFRYWRDRRAGVTIDYAKIFSANELAILGEHNIMPWEEK